MLKDLDKRQNEQQGGVNQSVAVPLKNKNGKFIFILMSIVVLLNVVGIVGWQLYSENQQLKVQHAQMSAIQPLAALEKPVQVSLASNEKEIAVLPISAKENSTLANDQTIENDSLITAREVSGNNVKSSPAVQASVASLVDNSSNNAFTETTTAYNANSNETFGLPKTVNKPKLNSSTEQKKDLEVAESSLTISRTQLSPQALAANKISEAEQAMERNDLAKAESLFEEVLLVMPEHVTARKQLAALWYGKKHYQDAVNLLSQGISLAPEHEEMRLMSARIYYERGQARQAFNILSPLEFSINTEVQALLANVSAELNEHESAILAYQKLITLESDVGRWWLGLAVSMDSIGQFVPARDAYNQAIDRNNLSMSAMQFARQRLIELGE